MKYCCRIMERAITNGYIVWLIIHDETTTRLTPAISHYEHGHPVLKLNLCPWCGAKPTEVSEPNHNE